MTGAVRDCDVLVVGGGPAGSATAYFLAKSGADVLLLDRASFPRDKPCAEYLSPQASRLLHEMGVLEAVERSGAAQLTGMQVRAPNGAVIHGEFAAAHGFHGFRDRGLALRRTVLDGLLLDAARGAGARVLERTMVRDLLRDDAGRVIGVSVDDAAGRREMRASLVVGADGLRSVVGRRAGLIRQGRWPRRTALVTHFEGVTGLSTMGEMHVAAGDRGYLGIAPVGGGVTNVAVVVPASRAPEMAGDAEGFLMRWIESQPHLRARFAEASRVSPVRAVGTFNSRARIAWLPGLALVGDAADFFDPFTGEGIYAALRGGEMLSYYAFEAVRATTPARSDVALAAYDRARRHTFGGKWRVERLIGTAVAFPAIMNRAARALASRPEMADLLVGVAGDFVPPARVLRPSFILGLLLPRSVRRNGSARPENHLPDVPATP